jgi:hypothetical protein
MGGWSSPLSCGVFLRPPLSQAVLLLVAGQALLLLPSPASPGLLIYSSRKESPPPSSVLRVPHFFARCLYCSYCLLLSFPFFPGWRSVCPGSYAVLAQGCLWEYCVLLSSPCLPKLCGHGQLVAWGPSWFLCLTWSGDSLLSLKVWKGQSFASSQWFCLQGVSPGSLQDFTIGGTLSASSL